MGSDLTVPQDVRDFVGTVTSPVRRRDATTLLGLMTRVTGAPARLYGTMIGFGQYHYEYASGHAGDSAAAGFAPRAGHTVIYLMDGIEAHAEALARLGNYRHGVGCLYLEDLSRIDLAVLEQIVSSSYHRLTAGSSGARDQEGSVEV